MRSRSTRMWAPQLDALGARLRWWPRTCPASAAPRAPRSSRWRRPPTPASARSTTPASIAPSCAVSRWAATWPSSSGGRPAARRRPRAREHPGRAGRPEAAAGRRALAERLGHEGTVPRRAAAAPPVRGRAAELWDRVKDDDRRPARVRDRGGRARDGRASGLGARPRDDRRPDDGDHRHGRHLIPPDVTAGIADGVPSAELLRIEGAAPVQPRGAGRVRPRRSRPS